MPTQTNKTKAQSSSVELYQIELTKAQLKALSSLLPKGFALETPKKNNRDTTPPPAKKLFTNEGTQVTKKPAKPADYINENILINKHALRDPGKRRLSTHFEFKYPDFEPIPTTSSKSYKSNNDAIRKCHNLLQKLKKHPPAAPFLFPVDVKALGLIDYNDVVSEPMDLNTVENKLKSGQYASVNLFAADIRKIWNNAFLYNIKGSPIYQMTVEMSTYFEKIFRDIENVKFNDTVRDLEKKVELLSKQITELHQKGLTSAPEYSKVNRSGTKGSKTSRLMEKPLTTQEKKVLGENIKRLPPEHLRGVWDIVSQRLNQGSNQEELEFDIESLPVKVARELDRFVKNKMSLVNRAKNKNKGKELTLPRGIHPSSSNQKQHEGDFDAGMKGEDDLTTQHHSAVESDGKPDSKNDLNNKGGASPSNSSESSFISDTDSDREDEPKNKDNLRVGS